ncbi:MAG: O-antigen ligase family protein [Candidatus Thiodiazotropha sp. 6PLUC2]
MSKGPVSYELGVVTFHPYSLCMLIVLPFAIWRTAQKPSSYGFRMIEMVIILLALSYLQSTLLSETMLKSGRLAFHALFIPIVSYFICKALIRNEKEYLIAMKFLIGSILLFSVATIVLYIQTGLRPVVLEIQPIGVSALVIVAFFYFLYNKNQWNIFKITGLLIVSSALILSMSRVYILFSIVSPVFIKLLKKKAVIIWSLMFFLTLTMTLVFTYTVEDYSMAHTSADGAKTMERMYDAKHVLRALAGRAYVYKVALKDFWDSVVFGVGIRVGEIQVTPHNYHVEWLQYGGVIGYLLYALIFIFHAKNISKYIRNDSYLQVNGLILLGTMTNSLTNGFMHGIMPYIAFIIMGLSEARVNIHKKNIKNQKKI